MRLLYFILISGFLRVTCSKPNNFRSSINQVLKSLQENETPVLVQKKDRLRPKIITKFDFQRMDRSSGMKTPAPIMVSTGLTVTQQERIPKEIGFTGLESAVAAAPIVQGIRVPDDPSDNVIHRNGRFINNVFVPDNVEPELPSEFTVSSQEVENKRQLLRSGRSYWSDNDNEQVDYNQREERKLPFNFNFENFYAGRKQDMLDATALESRTNEVYLKPDDPTNLYYAEDRLDTLHSDRSAYTFEPADTQSGFSILPSSILPNSDFEIKEQSYQMCPGCPTFNIPVPVPKSSFYPTQDSSYGVGTKKAESLIDQITTKIISTVEPLIVSAKSWLNPVDSNDISGTEQSFSDRLSTLPSEKSDISPFMFASVAAVGLGVATLISSGLQVMSFGVGRTFSSGSNGRIEEALDDDIFNEIQADYDPSNALCLPRHFCEKMKRNKHILDEFQNTKKIGRWTIDRLFDTDTVYKKGEAPFYNQCNLRECIYSLLS
ncbi:uncharacterized protein LOC111701705 [Eurytemora carolleeae]|uniref:uncharacterized protein LOC111701705 n=1 Tax=Eurytemora carolleeae TaxID=1294199 RepID=UPI000C78F377|nr:uncharacterized protein LOC111701705 [Eurytemora carolleeae]|eukprot:XP_023328879.1 uncharacterized protein LOC111701705 [Eurytemora affinis]